MRRLVGLLSLLLACRGDETAGATTETTGSSEGTTTTAGAETTTSGDATATTGAETTTNEESSSGPVCPPNSPPAIPMVVEPAPDRIDVLVAELAITVSEFSDIEGSNDPVLQVEIFDEEDDAPDARVWSVEVSGATTVMIADGVWDLEFDPAHGGPGFEDWKDYHVRARWADGADACAAWSEWSEWLEFRTDDGSTALFDESIVRDFHLEIGPDSWDAIDAEAYPPGCVPYNRNYYSGTLRFEDQVFEGVGIKIKGGCGSSRDLGGKASFKVNLEWDDPEVPGCPASRRLMGEKSFSFHNGVQDDSASHERLGYALFRELGIPAPRAASVRLFVNDELWGLYTHVETIDRRFLDRWFDSRHGALYEGTYWCELSSDNVPPGDEDTYCLTREFSPDACSAAEPNGDPLDYQRLRELVDQIEALEGQPFLAGVEEFFDYDRFLTTWAVEAVISHWDNYAFHIRNNYRVYHDPGTLRWTLISTGIDQTFRGDEDPWGVEGVLAVWCVEDPECDAAFAARLAEVSAVFDQFGYAERAAAMFDQLSPYVQEDPRREYGFTTFVNRHDELQDYVAGRSARIDQYLEARGY